MQENTSGLHKALYGFVGILLVAIVAVVGLIVVRDLSPRVEAVQGGGTLLFEQDDAFDGIVVFEPPRQVPDFTLTSHEGTPLSLGDLRGQPVLMTFGFTHCPDICPLTLNEFKKIREALGDDGENVHFVFVSVDGARDTPEVLASYFRVRQLDDFMLGMTGEEIDLRRIGVDYNLKFEFGTPNEAGRYNVDHTAGAFLIDAGGAYVAKFAFGTAHDVIANYIAELQIGRAHV